MIPAVIGNFLFCCCRNDWFSTACWVDEIFFAFWMLEDGRWEMGDGRWEMEDCLTRRHEGTKEGCWMLDGLGMR
jgi:hypothetical protein